MPEISQAVRRAIAATGLPQFRIAQLAGLHPSVASKVLTGRARIRPADERVIALARAVGVPSEEAFRSGTDRPASVGELPSTSGSSPDMRHAPDCALLGDR